MASPPSATATAQAEVYDDDDDDEDLLVSEFPPPPFYYRRTTRLVPPPIPRTRLEEYSAKAAAVMKQAVAAMETKFTDDAATSADAPAVDLTASMVTVFGDVVVEDPLLACVPDDCSDPTQVRDAVIRLNRKVMQGYATLVNELVHNPLDNKLCRDELSHNVLLMLHECNKFREHQAREILIETLENQLVVRRSAVQVFQKEIATAKEVLSRTQEVASSGGNNDDDDEDAEPPPITDIDTVMTDSAYLS